jgi:hypothetical protein
MRKENKKHRQLQQAILHRCHHGSGDKYQRYEDCKDLLKDAEREKIIAGSDWNEWVKLVCAVLGM